MKIVIIGCGVMGSALARHFAKKHAVILCDKGSERGALLAKEIGAEASCRQADAVEKADMVVLAVKPKDIATVSKTIAASMKSEKLLLSVLAGVSLQALAKYFSKGRLVRAMPNLSIVSGDGIIGLAGDGSVDEQTRHTIDALLEGLGLLTWLQEDKFDAFTALAGSGPAFILVMIEAMIESGIFLGFGADEAKRLVLQTIAGTVSLIRHTHEHPAELKWKIASPGGTTIAGLRELEKHALCSAIIETFAATYHRTIQMREQHN